MEVNWFLTSRSLVLSIILHVLIGVVLIYSFDFSSKPTPPAKPIVNIVKAAAVDKKQVDLELERLKKQEDEKIAKEIKRLKDIEKKADEAKKKRIKEEKKAKDAKKKRLADEKKAANAKKKRLADKKKADEAKKKRLADKKKADEAEKKRLAQEKALQEQLDAELEAEQQERDQTILAKYVSLIKNDISNNFNRLGLSEGLSCVILIRMLESGKVVEASIINSSGNDLFDRRAETAVYSASPLPVPDEVRIFNKMRSIEFTFKPKI